LFKLRHCLNFRHPCQGFRVAKCIPAAYRRISGEAGKANGIAANLVADLTLFHFQIKIASCNFDLPAAARARSRLASRNASHFVAASLPRIPIPNKRNVYLEWELLQSNQPFQSRDKEVVHVRGVVA
jgi:hypothetical protein